MKLGQARPTQLQTLNALSVRRLSATGQVESRMRLTYIGLGQA